MATSLKGRRWWTLAALLLLSIWGVAMAGERPAAPRHPSIVIYVGTG